MSCHTDRRRETLRQIPPQECRAAGRGKGCAGRPAGRDSISRRAVILCGYFKGMVLRAVPPLRLAYTTVMSPEPFTRYSMVRVESPA